MSVERLSHWLFGCLLIPWILLAQAAEQGEEKIYVAVEGEGKIAVFDAGSRERMGLIDLAYEVEGRTVMSAPHNVQVAPDGRTVWVTANSGHHGSAGHASHSAHEAAVLGEVPEPLDEVVVIDPMTDSIARRIPIAKGAHLAHVVITPDSNWAYVTAQDKDVIYRINARTFQVDAEVSAPRSSQPHGLRVAPDATRAYVALLGGRAMGLLTLSTLKLERLPLDGAAVQTAVTPDGRQVLATLYDRKQVAIYDVAGSSLRTVDLFDTARGPVQLYPSPDSRYVYVADQGHYFDQPNGEWVYKIDLQHAKVVWAFKAGTAPHGIVVAPDGRHAYVTNLLSNDLSVLDLEAGREVARLPVGSQPNGVSIWSKRHGGTP